GRLQGPGAGAADALQRHVSLLAASAPGGPRPFELVETEGLTPQFTSVENRRSGVKRDFRAETGTARAVWRRWRYQLKRAPDAAATAPAPAAPRRAGFRRPAARARRGWRHAACGRRAAGGSSP